MEFAQKLKYLRINNGLTQADVSYELGINIHSYQRYEVGTRFPSPDIIQSIANLYGVEVFCLFTTLRIEKVPKKELEKLINRYQ